MNHKLGLILQGDLPNLQGHKHEHDGSNTTEFFGGHFEYCDCGSVRKVGRDGKPVIEHQDDKNGWHTCTRCTPQLYRTLSKGEQHENIR